MLSVILAFDDPYSTAGLFQKQLGWTLVFATPADSDDRLACVELAGCQVMLGTAGEEFLAPEARPYRGAGVEVYVNLGAAADIAEVYERHKDAGVVTSELSVRPWGEKAFQFTVDGYRFMVAGE